MADADTRTTVERHLAICPECAHRLRALRRTADLLARMPPERLDRFRRESLLNTFRQSSPAASPEHQEPPSPPPGPQDTSG